VVQTAGTLLDLRNLRGLVRADPDAAVATFRAGTPLREIGGPLWEHGLSLLNQGDTEAQTIAGATATGTKGSGVGYGSISSTITGVRMVTGNGDVVTVDETQLDLLHAAQVSLGLLGVVTEISMRVAPAYNLRESNAVMPVGRLLDEWDDLLASYRHFSFFWAPDDDAHELYGLPPIPADHCYVKMLMQEPADPQGPALAGAVGSRVGRAHLVYPDVGDDDDSASFVELEHMIPGESARDAFLEIRRLMLTRPAGAGSPLQLRWQRADEAYLSAQHHRDSASVSVSGVYGADYEPYLRTVDRILAQWSARPHWGKQHFLTAERIRELYPRLPAFLEARAALDPQGIFLNDHFRAIFALD
jgi:FAD/FMN-containing dehydrogenase